MDAQDKALLKFLEEMVNEGRLDLLQKVMQDRTRYITVMLEDIYQPHNASAVLRTCDCFGIQDVHIVENRNEYTINPEVELGAAQWLNMYRYNQTANNTFDAINKLKDSGYRIVATTPHTNHTDLPDFNLDNGPIALLFGTEMRGLSDHAIDMADEYLRIPMFGFSESLNISVSAAIILQSLRMRLNTSEIDWQLSENEKEEIQLKWIKNSVKNSKIIEREFKKRYQN